MISSALASVAQWIEHQPVNQEMAGLIPSQGTCVVCRLGLWVELCERQPIDVCFSLTLMFLSLSLPPPSLKIKSGKNNKKVHLRRQK